MSDLHFCVTTVILLVIFSTTSANSALLIFISLVVHDAVEYEALEYDVVYYLKCRLNCRIHGNKKSIIITLLL